MKLKKSPKPRKNDFVFPENHKEIQPDTKEERAEKDRLIRAWLRKGNKIKKIQPVFTVYGIVFLNLLLY